MLLLVIFLGTFLSQPSMIMIYVPMFIPIVHALGFEPIWFGLIMLIALEMGMTTPPVRFLLFVMKGVVPVDVTMGEIWRTPLPYLMCDVIAIVIIICFPQIALFLPGFMR